MDKILTLEDISMIIDSLEYTRHNFENYQKYPSYEYKMKRMNEVNDVLTKVRDLKKKLKIQKS